MKLNEFVATTRRVLFEQLKAGLEPQVGTWDATLLADAKSKGTPQVGTTRYEPDAVVFEFVYPDSASTVVLAVRVASPHRIVLLPVPAWVVEQIWQGEIDGSYHFEPDALQLVAEFTQALNPEENAKRFGPKQPLRRE